MTTKNCLQSLKPSVKSVHFRNVVYNLNWFLKESCYVWKDSSARSKSHERALQQQKDVSSGHYQKAKLGVRNGLFKNYWEYQVKG